MKNTLKQRSLAIIDDSTPVRNVVGSFLSSAGIKVLFEAVNGRDGLEKLANCHPLPDTCLLDIDMPIMNGYDTASQIKEKWPDVKIIMFSVSNDQYAECKAIAAGADMFLNKGCDPQVLLAAIAD